MTWRDDPTVRIEDPEEEFRYNNFVITNRDTINPVVMSTNRAELPVRGHRQMAMALCCRGLSKSKR